MSFAARFERFRASGSPRHISVPMASQCGAAALLVVLVLLLAATLIVLAMGRVGVQEQTISGNEQRSHKAINAAQAGFEYGMTWLANNFVNADREYLYGGPISPTDPNDPKCACWPRTLAVPNNITPGTGETYNVQVTITPKGTGPSYNPYSMCSCAAPTYSSTVLSPYLQIVSVATDANDASVTASVEQYAIQSKRGSDASRGAPPLVLNGCYNSSPTGTPDIYPCTTSDTNFPNEAILGTNSALTWVECGLASSERGTVLDPEGLCEIGDGDGDGYDDNCPSASRHGHIPPAALDIHGGDVTENVDASSVDATGALDGAWKAAFPNMSRDEFKNKSAKERDLMLENAVAHPKESRNHIYFDAADSRSDSPAYWGFNTNHWTLDLGSGNTSEIGTIHQVHSPCGTIEPRVATHPVTIYFGNGGNPNHPCPKINSDVTIWGIVYFEACDDQGQGWGNGTIFGAVIVETPLGTTTSNGAVCCIADYTNAPPSEGPLFENLVRVPGTSKQQL